MESRFMLFQRKWESYFENISSLFFVVGLLLAILQALSVHLQVILNKSIGYQDQTSKSHTTVWMAHRRNCFTRLQASALQVDLYQETYLRPGHLGHRGQPKHCTLRIVFNEQGIKGLFRLRDPQKTCR